MLSPAKHPQPPSARRSPGSHADTHETWDDDTVGTRGPADASASPQHDDTKKHRHTICPLPFALCPCPLPFALCPLPLCPLPLPMMVPDSTKEAHHGRSSQRSPEQGRHYRYHDDGAQDRRGTAHRDRLSRRRRPRVHFGLPEATEAPLADEPRGQPEPSRSTSRTP